MTGLYRVLPCFNWFRVYFIRFFQGFYGSEPFLQTQYRVLSGFTRINRDLPGFTEFYLFELVSSRFHEVFQGFYGNEPFLQTQYRVLSGFTRINRVLPGFTGFYRVFTEANLFFKLSTEFDRNGVSLCFLLNVSELLSFLIEFFLGPIALRTGLP